MTKRITNLALSAAVLLSAFVASGDKGRIPAWFEENLGQTDCRVKYIGRGGREGTFYFTDDEVLARLPHGELLRLRFEGGSPSLEGEGEQVGRSAYFIGRKPPITGARHVAKVRYRHLYEGVDALFRITGGKLEMALSVEAGADLSRMKLRVEGPQGLFIAEEGDLVAAYATGQLRMSRPRVLDPEGAAAKEEAEFRLGEGGTVRVELWPGQAGAVVVDPVLTYSSYLGGSESDEGNGVAVDAAGNIYLVGGASFDFPLANPYQSTTDGFDAYVAKFTPDGSALIYATFLGGSSGNGDDIAYALAVDDAGYAYVTGLTTSTDFPVVNPIQANRGALQDAFVAKFDPTGQSLVYSTYLGGNNADYGRGIATDGSGAAYVVGYTSSTDFPRKNAFQQRKGKWEDVFVTKLDAVGAMVYSTYLGGNDVDLGWGVAVDAAGACYVTGDTNSSNFPLKNAIDDTLIGGAGFVTKLSPSGTSLVYSTYLGGSYQTGANGVAVDSVGEAIVVGWTQSPDFPVANAFQPTCGTCAFSGNDAFVSKLKADGSGFVYSTYLGADRFDEGSSLSAVVAAPDGSVYAAGGTDVKDFPTHCSIAPFPGGPGATDVTLVKLAPQGTLEYSTFFGSTDTRTWAVALGSTGSVYVVGDTFNTNLAMVSPFQSTYGGDPLDAFIFKVTDSPCPPLAEFYGVPRSGTAPLTVAFTSQARGTVATHAWSFGDGAASNAVHPAHTYLAEGAYDVTLTLQGAAGSATESKPGYIRVGAIDNFIAGPGPAALNPNQVRIFSLGGNLEQDFAAYGAGSFGTRVAGGDLDGDTVGEILTGPGPGAVYGPHVRAFRADATPIDKVTFFAYGTLKYGVNVASGDLDGDRIREILTGAGPGAVFGPHVRGFDWDGGKLQVIGKVSFFAYKTLKYGVNIASGDIEPDGYGEILTGPGPGEVFGPQLRGFDYDAVKVIPLQGVNGNAFPALEYGCEVAAGDLDGDGQAEALAGPGPGKSLGERVRGFDLTPMAPLPGLDALVFFFGGYGLKPAVLDPDGDGTDAVLAGRGPDPTATSRLRGFDYQAGSLNPLAGTDFIAFPGLPYGVNVASSPLGY